MIRRTGVLEPDYRGHPARAGKGVGASTISSRIASGRFDHRPLELARLVQGCPGEAAARVGERRELGGGVKASIDSPGWEQGRPVPTRTFRRQVSLSSQESSLLRRTIGSKKQRGGV